jgi:hypothetical protein
MGRIDMRIRSALVLSVVVTAMGLSPAYAVGPRSASVHPAGSSSTAASTDCPTEGAHQFVVGVPSKNAVDVRGAGPRGTLDPRYDIRFTEADTNLASVTGLHPAVGFGSAVLLADVTGDYCPDLIVGAAHTGTAATGGVDRGAVDIFPGKGYPSGEFDLTAGIRLDGPQAGSLFGSSFALHRRAGVADLFIGAPGYSSPQARNVGAVLRYTVAASDPPQPQLAQTFSTRFPHAGNHFGAVLDVAFDPQDLTAAPNPVLVVGTPDGWVSGQAGAGIVEFFAIDSGGSTAIVRWLNQDSPGVPGTAEAGDHFGASLSSGYDGSPTIVGVPGEDLGTMADAGMVQVVTLGPPAAQRALTIGPGISQSSARVPGVAEAGDRFGTAVLLRPGQAANANNGYAPPPGAYVGSPGENIGSLADAGEIQWLTLTSTSATGGPELTQGRAGLLGDTLEAGDSTGARLASLGVNGDLGNELETLVSAPGEGGAHTTNAGLVFADFRDTTNRPPPWIHFGYSAGAVTGLRYGTVLAKTG